MLRCPSCAGEVSGEALSCPSCGAALDASLVPTRVRTGEPRGAASKGGAVKVPSVSPHTSVSPDSIDDARFAPGYLLGGRYRVVGLLGRGGMGEVYRAEDLVLRQTVALKLLPEPLSGDGAALERFRREVRVARQISHPNVCRVYDIGEAEGLHFLSMEFIKGEELASVLKRFGRLPADKAAEIARQICAGLAAAHKGGVLHRDLKPANVMIDEAGDARVTDFGLAALAEETRGDEQAGTPAYMSPEQLAGKELTPRSDIYSLGLVLYELFTGRRAFDARTLDELLRLRRSDAQPSSPSSHVKDLDPSVERVIERCLDKDPEKRPASALQVAAALPGGDPLAAALAMGETPSPEMVAAAPKEGVLRPAVASALLATFVGLLALCCWLTKYTAVYRVTPLEQPPEALRVRARDVIKKLGYPEQPLDSADGILLKQEYLRYIAEHDHSPARWEGLRAGGPGAYRFWYRQSPRYFMTLDRITVDNPALAVSGMTILYLDMSGRLKWFVAVPPQREPAAPAEAAPDWSLAFREAGLDVANFQPVASTSVPLHAYDARAAWDGADPARPELKTHVEAAAFRGKLTYFETIYPWDQPERQEQTPLSAGQRALGLVSILYYLLALVGSALLARRNLRLGRGDWRGAAYVAFCLFAVNMLAWPFDAHHNGLPNREYALFFRNVALNLLVAVFVWLLYVAFEPYVRRRWPGRIISWSRLLTGGWRDPLVGRDILIGAVCGVGAMLCAMLAFVGLRWLGRPPELTLQPAVVYGFGTGSFFSRFASQFEDGLLNAFIALFLLLLFVVILRRERLALVAVWLFYTLLLTLLVQVNVLMTPFTALMALLIVLALYRFGLLAAVSAVFIVGFWVYFPLTTELNAWYATDFVIGLAVCVALVLYGFRTSLGGQPLFRGDLWDRAEPGS